MGSSEVSSKVESGQRESCQDLYARGPGPGLRGLPALPPPLTCSGPRGYVKSHPWNEGLVVDAA